METRVETEITGHYCAPRKRIVPYPTLLCSMCRPGQGSFDIAISRRRKRSEEHRDSLKRIRDEQEDRDGD